MAMDKNSKQVLVLPFPAQGHITPMIQLSKRLMSKGVKVTLISAFIEPAWIRAADDIPVEDISAEAAEADRDLSNVDDFFERLRRLVREKLPGVAAKHKATYLVYDSIIPWTLDIAAKLGMRAAPLFTQPWAVNAIHYSLHSGLLKLPLESLPVSVAPAYPTPLELRDLPSFLYDSKSFPTMLSLLTEQFSNLAGADCVLCNTFDALEEDVLRWVSGLWTVRNVGPTLPLPLDHHTEDDSDTLVGWLRSKAEGSVVYVAFGSVAEAGEEQMKEIALGVANSGFHYVWAVREAEAKKLPRDLMKRMVEEEERGLVVNWCDQRRVLGDKAVGCFVSHCGWNSTLEAMCSGVPMVGVPLWSDQTTNAKFVSDVWGFGLRPKPDDDAGLVAAHRIERCIREVMTEGETRLNVVGNSLKWKKLAEDAVSEGGSSDANILQFVANL